jgi:DNA modification methylase
MNEIVLPWTNLSKNWGHSWHKMCTYLGSFPPGMARTFLSIFSKKNDIIIDPFCGRGTSLLEARLCGRIALASDLNPIAVALTKAKNVLPEIDKVHDRINCLEKKFDLALYLPEAQIQSEDIQLIYNPVTLAQLCYLRRELLNSNNLIDDFLVGLILGIMHGAERKDGTSAYASISMPNTFSMSPTYVRRYVQNNNLQRTERNVFSLLREKIDRLPWVNDEFKGYGYVTKVDVRELSSCTEFSHFRGKVDLVITSPPYLNIVNYAKQNWIRMWFLNEKAEEVSEMLDDNLTLSESLDFLERAILEMKKMVSPGGIIVLILGDVIKSNHSVLTPARELIRRMVEKDYFRYIGFLSDHINIDNKTTRIWKETRGRATNVDRIIILSNNVPEIYYDDNDNMFCFDKNITADILAQNAKSFAGLS